MLSFFNVVYMPSTWQLFLLLLLLLLLYILLWLLVWSLCLPSDVYDIPQLLNIMIWQWVDKNIRLSIIFQSWSWWWQETKCSSINSIMNQSELNLHTHYIQLDYQSYSKLIKKEVKEPIITHLISNSSMIIQQSNV